MYTFVLVIICIKAYSQLDALNYSQLDALNKAQRRKKKSVELGNIIPSNTLVENKY